MTRKQRTWIKILGLANVVVYIAAGALLWYVWPVLTEPPESVVSANEFLAPVPPPTGAVARSEASREEDFPPLTPLSFSRLEPPTPAVATEAALGPTAPGTPASLAAGPTPTPYTLIWPSARAGSSTTSGGGWGQPVAVPTVTLAPQQVNVLLLGCDYRRTQKHWRTDTIIVVSLDPIHQKISMLSIPRDLWVYIPGYGSERINTADFLGEQMGVNKGKADLIRKVILLNLGIPIHYYARVNYDAFEKIINTIGGVTVEVDCPYDEIFEDSRSPTGWSHFSIQPGIHHMDGWTALTYARLRKATNDFNRSRRQQAIMRGVWQGALATDLLKDGPRLWNILHESVQTDLGLQDVLALGYMALRVAPENIRSYYIDSSCVQSWTTPAGAAVLLPVPSRVQEVVHNMFSVADIASTGTSEKPTASKPKVKLLDGAGNRGRANLAATQFRWKGMRVVSAEAADRSDYARTIIIDYGTRSESISRILEMTGLTPDRVRKQPDPYSAVDFVIILGQDYDPCQNQ